MSDQILLENNRLIFIEDLNLRFPESIKLESRDGFEGKLRALKSPWRDSGCG